MDVCLAGSSRGLVMSKVAAEAVRAMLLCTGSFKECTTSWSFALQFGELSGLSSPALINEGRVFNWITLILKVNGSLLGTEKLGFFTASSGDGMSGLVSLDCSSSLESPFEFPGFISSFSS